MASTANTVSSDPQPAFNPVSVTDSNGNAVAYQLNPPGIAPEGVTQYYVYTFTAVNVTYTMTFSYISAYSTFPTTVSCLAVGGGGSVFKESGENASVPGGGAGGMVEVTFTMPPSTDEQSIKIKVGAGSPAESLIRGEDTIVTTGLTDTDGSRVENITAIGGGSTGIDNSRNGSGGSGAGGDLLFYPGVSTQQKTYTGTVSGNGYGNNGGTIQNGSEYGYGGGGGAGGVGGNGYSIKEGSLPVNTTVTFYGGAGGLGLQPTLPGIPNTTLVDGISTPIIYAAGGVGYGEGTTLTGTGANTGNGANGRGSADGSGCSGIVVIAIPIGAMSPTGPSV